MPTYEYECQKCKKTFEIFQSMKDEALSTCPKTSCRMKSWGRGRVRRLLGTGAGLIFKGSGFYITDYRSEGYKKAAKSESSGSTASKDTPKSEASSTKSDSGSKGGSAAKKTS